MTNTDRLAQALREITGRFVLGIQVSEQDIAEINALLAEHDALRKELNEARGMLVACYAMAQNEVVVVTVPDDWRKANIAVSNMSIDRDGLRNALREIDADCAACINPEMTHRTVREVQKKARAALASLAPAAEPSFDMLQALKDRLAYLKEGVTAAVEGDAMPKRYTGEDMLARAAYMACQWEDNKPPKREKEVIDMLTQAATDLLRVKDAEQPATENTELHEDFPRSTNMSDVPELAEAISRSANEILVRALAQCYEALKHSKPEMAHYPEPVKRHSDAMEAALEALNKVGVTPK